MRFEGTSGYVAQTIKVAVNAAIALRRPLLIKGEPGTGKDGAGAGGRKNLDAPLIEWHVKSTTKAMQGLYEYDAVSRLRDRPARRRARAATSAINSQARQAVGCFRCPTSGRCC